ncbi:ROK family protein [Thalassoglobus polymorphus]|uniref:Glucokinase n=1 Tax=Thalassoglobus polymorphus TaxID=2527994 RepID=A0A517QPM2_9PLAN|nr:ROK family protein [Thalassoglobus polymorphus]QDT33537.1 Glucokinase [Thalassoglobus polymorphus]
MVKLYAGVDVGGTSIKCALGTSDGTLLKEGAIPTDSHEGPDDVLRRIGEHINALVREVGGDSVTALGMGLPGLVDVHQGITRYLPNMTTHWRDVPAAAKLSAIVDCPVRLLNDVRTATLGELTFGRGKSVDTMAFIAIGTGIGGGIVIDGKLRLGPMGAAGEIGHQTIDRTGPLCGCGNHGCLETLASGTALTAEGVRLMLMGLAPNLHELVDGDPGEISVELMGQVANQDDPVRDAILNAAADIAIGVANIITTIHPELIVIGGGVANLGALLLDRIRQDVEDRVGRLFPVDDIRIERSLLKEKAGVLGAVALGIHGLPA